MEKIEFDEIAVYFSKEEWDCLREEEKGLYRDVMMENYRTLTSLGFVYVKPAVIQVIERGEEPYVRDNQVSKRKSNHRYTRAGKFRSRNTPEEHFGSVGSAECVMEDIGVIQTPQETNIIRRNSPSNSAKHSASKSDTSYDRANCPGFQERHKLRQRTPGMAKGREPAFSMEENEALVGALQSSYSQLLGPLAAGTAAVDRDHMWAAVVSAVNEVALTPRTARRCRKRVYDIRRQVLKKRAKMQEVQSSKLSIPVLFYNYEQIMDGLLPAFEEEPATAAGGDEDVGGTAYAEPAPITPVAGPVDSSDGEDDQAPASSPALPAPVSPTADARTHSPPAGGSNSSSSLVNCTNSARSSGWDTPSLHTSVSGTPAADLPSVEELEHHTFFSDGSDGLPNSGRLGDEIVTLVLQPVTAPASMEEEEAGVAEVPEEEEGEEDGSMQAPVGLPGDHHIERAGSSQAVSSEAAEEPLLGASSEVMEGEGHAASDEEEEQQETPSSWEHAETLDVLEGIHADLRDFTGQLADFLNRTEALLHQIVEQNRLILCLLMTQGICPGPAPAFSTSSPVSGLEPAGTLPPLRGLRSDPTRRGPRTRGGRWPPL
ncbi:uncharacterized protein WCC33_015960 [Rhinophrynus dorsalis]